MLKRIAVLFAMAAAAISVPARGTPSESKVDDGASNVVALGADPTGERDSSSAFDNAMAAGGTIIVPHGRYLLTKTINITKSGTCIIGQPRAVLYFSKGFLQSGLVAKAEPFTMKDLVIRDLVIECDKSNYTPGKDGKYACGVALSGVDGVLVENCDVHWFTFTGIAVTASKNVRVSHCSTLGGRHGIGVNGHVGNPRKNGEPYGCWHTVIDGCHIAETWDTFIPVGLCASYVTIRGCVCEGSAAHGFDIFNSDHVLVTGNTLSNWMDPGVLSPYAEQAVGIFVHCDWGNSLEIPTRNVVISGNLLIRDEYPPKVRPVGISVIGTVDGASIAGNVVCGGQTGLAVTDIKGQGKRFAPRNVVITGNVFKGQKLSLWIDSAIAMPVLVSSNIFDPECDGQIAHFGEKTQGVKFTNNAVMRGKLPRVPSGITWDPDDRRK